MLLRLLLLLAFPHTRVQVLGYKNSSYKARAAFGRGLWNPCDDSSIFTRQDTDFFRQERRPIQQHRFKFTKVPSWPLSRMLWIPSSSSSTMIVSSLPDHFCKESIEWQFWTILESAYSYDGRVCCTRFFFVWQDIFGQFLHQPQWPLSRISLISSSGEIGFCQEFFNHLTPNS